MPLSGESCRGQRLEPPWANLHWQNAASVQTPPDESFEDIMVAVVLEKLMVAVTTAVLEPHHISTERRSAINTARRIKMRRQRFRTILNSLEPTYSKLLHETFENQWDSEIADTVGVLEDTVVHKLNAKFDMDSAEKGEHLMHAMLEHVRLEFKWSKMLAILESAAEVARQEKAQSNEDVRDCQRELCDIEENGKPNILTTADF